MITKRARATVGTAIVILMGAAVVLGALVIWGAISPAQLRTVGPVHFSKHPVPKPADTGIPILVYHEMNNGCAAYAPVCNAHDPESVSTAQFASQMNYLRTHGYNTISLAQYERWLANPAAALPRQPVLLTADNGIGNFLQGAQPILAKDGYTMVAFVVTGFADGASGICQAPQKIAGKIVDIQPDCGKVNRGWDLTWQELNALSPRVYSFALEAGASGHFPQNYSRTCTRFYTCMVPGETTSAYEARVTNEIDSGLSTLNAKLPGRVNTAAWVVPFSDLGYPRCGKSDCTAQNSTGPPGWLSDYAASHFSVVFVEDASRNGVQNERFRFDVTGQLTEAAFQARLQMFLTTSSFAR